MARPVAQDCFDSLMFDIWPRMAAITDFGLASDQHYAALQFGVRCGAITLEALDEALGNGKKLTALVAGVPGQPYPGVVFRTLLDDYEVGKLNS